LRKLIESTLVSLNDVVFQIIARFENATSAHAGENIKPSNGLEPLTPIFAIARYFLGGCSRSRV
jgi:hypothetical protein